MKRKSAKPRQRHRATLGFLRLEPTRPNWRAVQVAAGSSSITSSAGSAAPA
ncbi:MAG TPA: hypothetical protein VLE27_09855 [Thermoanaerobaculia bacterium]|nr:hypothetical protein [Thermoanaerobaculia bacterium]